MKNNGFWILHIATAINVSAQMFGWSCHDTSGRQHFPKKLTSWNGYMKHYIHTKEKKPHPITSNKYPSKARQEQQEKKIYPIKWHRVRTWAGIVESIQLHRSTEGRRPLSLSLLPSKVKVQLHNPELFYSLDLLWQWDQDKCIFPHALLEPRCARFTASSFNRISTGKVLQNKTRV